MKRHEHFIVEHLMSLQNIYIFIRKLSIIVSNFDTDVMKDTRNTFILCFKKRPYKEVPWIMNSRHLNIQVI